jgi:putative lipoic acid-binding regulatory protein
VFHSKISRDECENQIVRRVESLAEKFGGRLTFKGIGIGDRQEDFTMIQKMVEAAKDYGAKSSFERPSMASSSLGGAFSSVAASISATQSELTNQETGKHYHVRPGLHESQKKAREKLRVVNEEGGPHHL